VEHIVIVGKGGVGKSSVAANISAALAEEGEKVLQIGYGHACDSTATLRGGREPLSLFIGREAALEVKTCRGFNGVWCLEAGRLGPGNRGGIMRQVAVEAEKHVPDTIIHDVSWESYGERLAQPFGQGPVKVFAVVSSDFPAIVAANSIFRTIAGYPFSRRVTYGGLIANGLTATFCESMVADFARHCGAVVHSAIPHSLVVMMSELHGKTVLEAAPLSHLAFAYRKLAKQIKKADGGSMPRHLENHCLREWGHTWAGLIHELQTGMIDGGAGI
jgi:nitrogenase iron protein NifH